ENPNETYFYAELQQREELGTQANVTTSLNHGLRAPDRFAMRAAFVPERYRIAAREQASYITGYASDQNSGGSGSSGVRSPGFSVQVGIFAVGARASQVLGAKPLRDETSVNLSGGLAVSPSSNFTLTADYFYIKINHRIMLSATFLQDSTLRILADSGVSGVGGVQYFTNGLDTRTEGVDFTANLRLPAVGAGTLDLTAGANWT